MNILVTGSNKSGSWQIRAEQLGRAIGADVLRDALDVAAYDLVVLVKRPGAELLSRIQASGVLFVWDVVDSWPQPEGNSWSAGDCLAWLRRQLGRIRPNAVVAATQQMADDIRAVFPGVPVLALPHHGRPGLKRTPIRPLQVVGYEGSERHLGSWREVLEAECARRGWSFQVNPDSINDLDVVVALREHDGYAPRHWKSNVKLANAQASGTPIVCGLESGYAETMGAGGIYLNEPALLPGVLDYLTPEATRARLAEELVQSKIDVQDVARDYRRWLAEVACCPA